MRQLIPCGISLFLLSCCSASAAGYVSSYGVLKKAIYEQTAEDVVAASPFAAYGFSAFAAPTTQDSILLVTLTPPGSDFPEMMMPTRFGFDYESTSDSQLDLDSAFPNGDYKFGLTAAGSADSDEAVVNLGPGSFPNTTPQLSGFVALGAVEPTKALALNWNSFEGATSDAFVQLTVRDDTGEIVFQTGWPGQSGALVGTARSVSVPAGTFQVGSTYEAALLFGRITARNTTAIIGSVGMGILAKETRVTIKTTGSGEDPGDEPPFLVSVTPDVGEQRVSVTAPVRFTFSVPMAPKQSITWSANVVPTKFRYSWSGDGRTLTCAYSENLPGKALISWTLDSAGFTSAVGDKFDGGDSGFFTTGASESTGPCDDTRDDDEIGIVSVAKLLNFVQTQSLPPMPDSGNEAMFIAMVASPATNPVTQATLQLPNGTSKALTNMFGYFSLSEDFASQDALDAAYPPGTYTVTVKRSSGGASLSLNLGAAPPTPLITSLEQPFVPTADSRVQWQPFVGVTPTDVLFLELHQAGGTNFHAPDMCIPRPLANTDTSIVVPANTMAPGVAVEGSLAFTRISTLNTNSVSDIYGYSSYGKVTQFKLLTSGGTPDPGIQLRGAARQSNGAVSFEVSAKPGATLTVEGSTDLKVWKTITTGAAPTGILQVLDPEAASMAVRFYRARQQ